jgi:hypothetical protein
LGYLDPSFPEVKPPSFFSSFPQKSDYKRRRGINGRRFKVHDSGDGISGWVYVFSP